MNQNKKLALRQATLTFIAKIVLYTAALWFLGWEQFNAPIWLLTLGVVGFSALSGWEVHKQWQAHFERKKQWKL